MRNGILSVSVHSIASSASRRRLTPSPPPTRESEVLTHLPASRLSNPRFSRPFSSTVLFGPPPPDIALIHIGKRRLFLLKVIEQTPAFDSPIVPVVKDGNGENNLAFSNVNYYQSHSSQRASRYSRHHWWGEMHADNFHAAPVHLEEEGLSADNWRLLSPLRPSIRLKGAIEAA